MGRDVPSRTGIKRNLDDKAATISGESAARKAPSSMFLVASSLENTDGVSCVSSALAIEDSLPDNLSFVNVLRKKADGRVSGPGHRGMCQTAERDFLFETGTKDTACHCNVVHRPRTLQEARRQPVALSRGTERPYIRSAMKPSTCPLEVGMSTSLEVVGVGAGYSADSRGDLARDARIRLLYTLSCGSTKAGYPKQLRLEATCAPFRLESLLVFQKRDQLSVRSGAILFGERVGRELFGVLEELRCPFV
ncbi:hypothetical protein HPB52_018928 [Rhipicephalus sanguineus]|uniref:Uncharacterized protein n=1 Tax=Rhipicephalus sanguineus TaxID=34632 RepID=A0A9D4TBC1_RHISA|nr:hypothetical protein HPB52_018928 [Rhipicephalus sanguineus]